MSGNMDSIVCIPLFTPSLCISNLLQNNDGASSIASFEDVGGQALKDLSVDKKLVIRDPRCKAKGSPMSGNVPDVKYVLQYKGLSGNVVECKCMLQAIVNEVLC